jgi:hypothetical protein
MYAKNWSPFKVMSVAHVIFPRWPIHYNTSSVFTSLVRDCWLPRACFFFMILASYTCATLLYCDLIIQLLAHGWWFSLGTPASSTTKTGRHDIAGYCQHQRTENDQCDVKHIMTLPKKNTMKS